MCVIHEGTSKVVETGFHFFCLQNQTIEGFVNIVSEAIFVQMTFHRTSNSFVLWVCCMFLLFATVQNQGQPFPYFYNRYLLSRPVVRAQDIFICLGVV